MSDIITVKLLIVEDDEDDYIITESLLSPSDTFHFEVEWVKNANQANIVLAENRHQLCLMDYQLGAEIGVDIVRTALANGFTAPIIMLTGQENTGVEIAAAEAGAVDYLVKDNLTQEQLFRAIRYALVRNDILSERVERNRAEAENRSKTEFLANLSHEIRTPLTAIVGFTELLINQHLDADVSLVEKLEIINRNSKHLLSLLNDTLDLSKIEAGKLETDIASIDFNEFILDIVSFGNSAAAEKSLKFTVNSSSLIPPAIESDETRLRQILLNLLSNAFKFTSEGGVDLTISMILQDNVPLLKFSVKDTGKGIQASELDRIFKPYAQADANQKGKFGTGLGLTISQKLAEKLGGHITATSTPEHGSEFILYVNPGNYNPEAVGALDLERSSLPEYSFKNVLSGKILVVDDVEDNRLLLCNILNFAGCEVQVANDGIEALDIVKQSGKTACDLILMDLNMPGMNGYEALMKIRAIVPHLPVIALTAGGLRGEREKCKAAGFNEYLTKPVIANLLLGKVKELLDAKTDTVLTTESGSSSNLILVVEDSEDANKALCELLELKGYQVISAMNAEQALGICNEQSPQYILSDLNLGGINGGQLLEKIQTLLPHSEYFIMSGQDESEHSDLPSFLKGYLRKPITLQDLDIFNTT